ncbi:LmbE family N-acetylglucosaminyl deacetylase [Hymenobacter luteus]|uniref:LmbE family N-acetylglucosaminyl deacetylase n=2 Tax=Hymenobacter TaxID=89966 RepID=A0A7W9WDL3_9BACT|nr:MULTISPECIES: PIG-L deacetylase family protein [Hymenobacter]MBB4602789.1 LmbE family N-acetylglucosaminyl deacetylase [Hymenobacter latericoloratus]MBB6060680.1 LmbE family N-acetylglucosaminyl deacetylase [Hymenobacter luteus]
MVSSLFASYPSLPLEQVVTFGATTIVAPHPDDESLGCGGLLALLRQAGVPVWCVLVTDGTMSHPNSRKFPAPARQALREQELRTALAILGVEPQQLLPLNLPDGAAAGPDTPVGRAAVQRLVSFWRQHPPATVLVPWRRDPHPDHRATSLLVRAALAQLPALPRVLEYVVWAWERATPTDLPTPGEVRGWQLSIGAVLEQKQQAMGAHHSQLPGSPIDDDPDGFTLSTAMLAHFTQPTEIYLEATDGYFSSQAPATHAAQP